MSIAHKRTNNQDFGTINLGTEEVKAAVEKAAAEDTSIASFVKRILIAQLKKNRYLPKQYL